MIVLSRVKFILLLVVVVAATATVVIYRQSLENWFRTPAPAGEPAVTDEHAGHAMTSATPGEREVLYWYDPMHPTYKSDKPGIAPDCGMKLVPRYADEMKVLEGMAPGTVRLSSEKQQLIGVRTGTVERQALSETIHAVGTVEMDETRVEHVHTKVNGWVRKVFVDYTWQHVHKGEPLFTVYSPELVSAQQEYLIALRGRDTLEKSPYTEVAENSSSLLRAARARLRLWDVTDEQVAELEATHQPMEELTFFSPVSGHVSERNVFPNQYITPEADLYTIVDHSHVWVEAQLYEYEIDQVRVGMPATMTVTALPGRTFRGRVSFIDPHLDMNTRTVSVRLEFPNPDLALKPAMFADVNIAVGLGRQLVVPREAVIDTGVRQLVFLARPNGYFEPRDIQIGPRLENMVVVLKGLEAGDTIVTSGAFLVDSESQLRAATEQMGEPAPHKH